MVISDKPCLTPGDLAKAAGVDPSYAWHPLLEGKSHG